jgi:hypothetical protein
MKFCGCFAVRDRLKGGYIVAIGTKARIIEYEVPALELGC